MNRYSLSDKAVQDLDDIFDYIAQQNPSAASKLFDAIRQKCRQVAEFPNMGKSYKLLSNALRGFVVGD
jgi:toxin ParE1/3/4